MISSLTRSSRAAVSAALMCSLATAAGAETIAVFDNPSYVDTAGSTGSESDNVQASLTSLGHTVTTFTGTSDTDIAAALAGANVLVIPETETGDLAPALSVAARAVIANFVATGGGLIKNGHRTRDADLLDAIFGFSLTTATEVLTIGGNGGDLTAAAVGTSFAGGPASLVANDATSSLAAASLPPGADAIYSNATGVTVARMLHGAGRVVFLSWDWYNAAPAGSQNNGWLSVLEAAVADAGICQQFPADADGDGVCDLADNCPADTNPGQEDTDSNGVGDACNDDEDADGDDWADGLDNCPSHNNPGQEDADSNGVGDVCNAAEDADGDDWADGLDNCPSDTNPGQEDADSDGAGDPCDNCPADSNAGQEDADGDGVGDRCDPDEDGDGHLNDADNCPTVANADQEDGDGDGVGDACDTCPADPNPVTDPELELIRDNINANHPSITALVPTRFDFAEGATGFSIGDGGNDMYDGGNRLNTNLATDIVYTNGVVTASDAQFGAGSSYFTVKHTGLFAMAATDISIASFSTTGNNGADGGGTADGAVLSTNVDGYDYTLFVKRVFNAGDPSINQIVIVPGTGAGVSHSFPSNTNDGLHTVTGLAGIGEIYYVLVARQSGARLDDPDVINVANEFLAQLERLQIDEDEDGLGDVCDPCTLNGTLGGLEVCDDGNLVDGDGCDQNCTASACGNGIPGGAEECDDGNLDDGDCCSSTCTFEVLGSPCADDGESCSDDACDGAGACTHLAKPDGTVCRPAGGDCDVEESCDGVAIECPTDEKSTASCRAVDGDCDEEEFCDGVADDCPVDGFLSSSVVCRPAADGCDVGEVCPGDSADCPGDAFAPNGTGCSDGEFCNGDETCQSGACQAGAQPCFLSCDEVADACEAGCPSTPLTCRSAAKSSIHWKDNEENTKDRLVWKWSKGESTSQTELGDPTDDADYALCVFAGTTANLIADAVVLADGSLWEAFRDKGYKYKSTADGLQRITLKGSDNDRSKAMVKGKGHNLPDVTLPLALPVQVQLINGETGICMDASFTSGDIKKNEAGQFKAKAATP